MRAFLRQRESAWGTVFAMVCVRACVRACVCVCVTVHRCANSTECAWQTVFATSPSLHQSRFSPNVHRKSHCAKPW